MTERTINSTLNIHFWFHLLLTVLAILGPFLFSWYLIVPAYAIVLLQFIIFKQCLLNATHDLNTEDDATFYSTLFEIIGFRPDRKRLKLFVRRYLYVLMIGITLWWQIGLGKAPLFF